jgi:hypothetical protein
MIVSGCGVNKETMTTYDKIKGAFQKAPPPCRKKCAPNQHATAEAYLSHANHQIAEKDEYDGHLKAAIGITRRKSLEAIKICQPSLAPKPRRLVALPLSAGRYLQDKFKISENRMIIKGYRSKATHNCTKGGYAKTGERRCEWLLNFR